MSSTFDHFKGKVILHAQFTTQDGQTDKVQGLLEVIQDDILAGNEPGCLTFRIFRDGNEFLMFEEYENVAAVKAHNDTAKFQAFASEVQSGTLLVRGPKVAFYEEV
ncbi:hypothetical protein FRC08_003688 [Ceratobasidium sp. 394]|nr:hypothetical protein FRC08_003688 [Ceratobasidium sp. 394]KAG9085398.1 hypothetical protein FS749_004453 [Ceratobasidium sp. UAMH 11750]